LGTSDRRQRHRASLRREILDAASQLFVEEGYHRVTMRRIAERIEYSPTTIYLHFKDKNDLLQTVCEETFSQLAGKLERLQKTAGTPLGYLRDSLRTYIDFGLDHTNQYAVTFMPPVHGLDIGPLDHSIGGRAFDALRQGVRACVENGDIQAPNIDMTAQALWASVHGITSLFITMKGFPFASKAALVDHLVDMLIAGLKTPAGTPRTPAQPPPKKKWDFFD
jgi:AcrR family transcriptional regulator